MPQATDPKLYDATHRATTSLLDVGPAMLEKYQIRLPQATPLYRYSSGSVSDGAEQSTRKIWTRLDNDTGNRWTGKPPPGAECLPGATGLYMSLEQRGGADTVFSELFHYQAKESGEKTSEVLFLDYKANALPELRELDGRKQYFMFMYHLAGPLVGIDLKLDSLLASEVHETLSRAGVAGSSLEAMYCDGEEATFCRAMGNCALELGHPFIYVTSTRNRDNINVILAGEGGPGTAPFPNLTPAGRSTFFVSASGAAAAVTTIEDMSFNAQFGD